MKTFPVVYLKAHRLSFKISLLSELEGSDAIGKANVQFDNI